MIDIAPPATAYAPRPRRVRVPLCPVPARLPAIARRGADRARLRSAIAARLAVDAEAVTLTPSGTAALTSGLRSTVQAGDVLMPTFSCPNVADAVLSAGLTPCFYDLTPSLGVTCDELAARMTARTRAVIVSHLFGIDAGIESVAAFCAEHGLLLVDDAAQAFGGRSASGRPLGTCGDWGVLSFGRHKPIYAGGGGALIRGAAHPTPAGGSGSACWRLWATDVLRRADDRLPRAIGLQTFDYQPDVAEDLERTGPTTPADPARCADAWLGYELGRWERTRMASLAHAESLLRSLPVGVLPVAVHEPLRCGPLNFLSVHVELGSRFDLAAYLAGFGVETTWLYYPLHQVGRLAHYGQGQYPNAETAWTRILCLPCRGSLGRGQIARLAALLSRYSI